MHQLYSYNLQAYYVADWLPIVIYGTFAVIAAFLDIFLPETMGRDYPETIEDAKHFNDKAYWAAKAEKEMANNAANMTVLSVISIPEKDKLEYYPTAE